MREECLRILIVLGSLQRRSVLRVLASHMAEQFEAAGSRVDVLDFDKEPLQLYNPDTLKERGELAELQGRVDQADVIVFATPDYHGTFSGAIKNFLDHFWHEFAGKLFVTVVASHEKGLTVADHLRTVARQCYAWALPYGISFSKDADMKDDQISSDSLKQRVEMMIRDVQVYGALLAHQRRADLVGTGPGFLARHRK